MHQSQTRETENVIMWRLTVIAHSMILTVLSSSRSAFKLPDLERLNSRGFMSLFELELHHSVGLLFPRHCFPI